MKKETTKVVKPTISVVKANSKSLKQEQNN